MPDQFSDDFYERWHHLLEDIDMSEVPLRFVREITVHMTDESVVTFDIMTMFANKTSVVKIEAAVEQFLEEHNDEVENIHFHINVEELASTVTQKVDKLFGK